MRKLIYTTNFTIDGCIDHTKGSPAMDIFEHYITLTRGIGTLLYGRKLYEVMVPFWPNVLKNPASQSKEAIEYAEAFCAIENVVVVSKTLQSVEEKNVTIISENLEEEVLKLKTAPGKDIYTGGAGLSADLVKLGLIDEYQFVVIPTIAGEGRRLWDTLSLQENVNLKLVENKAFQSGFVLLKYAKG